jgi:hypothetical protein
LSLTSPGTIRTNSQKLRALVHHTDEQAKF